MELVLKNGDYVMGEHRNLLTARGTQELLQRVTWKLLVKRASFPFLPKLGSQLHLLSREKPGNRLSAAKRYVQEALEDEKDVKVTKINLEQMQAGSLTLSLQMQYQGKRLCTTLTLSD